MTVRDCFRLLAVLFIAFFLSLAAQAQTVEYDRFKTASGIEIITGPNYQPKTVNQARGAAVWNSAFETSTGTPSTTGDHSPANPSGNRVPVKVKTSIPPAQVAKAVGRFAGKVLPGIGYAIAIKELADELGFKTGVDPAGKPTMGKADPAVCTVAPCFAYFPVNFNTGSPDRTRPFSTYGSACAATASNGTAWSANYSFTVFTSTHATCTVALHAKSNGSLVAYSDYAQAYDSAPPAPAGSYLPSTYQEFVDAVAAKSGWPSGSAINRVLKEDLEAGNKLEGGPFIASGPASSPGKSSTSTDSATGNTTTTNTTHNHTYEGAKISTVTTTTTNNYNPTTNTTTTITNVESPEAPKEEPDDTVTETPLPDQPKLYEPKYPQGLTSVWAQKKAELVATPLASLVSQLMPSVGAGGTCPAWNLNLSLGAWDYGTHNVAPPCYIWDWCKFFIIAGALLLARALIFGG